MAPPLTPEVNVERLRMIEAVIARMAGNSFLLKGWTVTLVVGLCAVGEAQDTRRYGWLAVFVVAVLGTLDAYYLALERRYRRLFDRAASGDDADPWSLRAGPVSATDVVLAVGSGAVWMLHGAALVVAVLVAVV